MRVVPVPDAAVGQPAVDLVLTDGSVDDDVRTFLMFLSARDFSPNTIRAYAYDLLKLMTFLESRGWSVQDFTPARALEFLQWLRQQTSRRRGQRYEVAAVTASGGVPLSARTCNRAMACVSSFYEYLITAERYHSRENPIVKQEDAASARVPARFRQPLVTSADQRPIRRVLRVRTTEPLPRPIPDDTYLAIIDQLRTLRDRALVELMWEGGFRPGEVLGLQLEDISCGRRRIVIRYRVDHPQNVRQKSRRERVVDLWEERALPALNRYAMLERPQDTDCPYLFLVGGRGTRRDVPLSYNGLFRMFTRATTRAGVRTAWLTPHCLRHTHATRMTELGMRELPLGARLGHASPESTRKYVEVSHHDVLADYRKALFGGGSPQ
jgi:integrase/recombinase XerD